MNNQPLIALIEFFRNIPEERWTDGDHLGEFRQQRCALLHMDDERKRLGMDWSQWWNGNLLAKGYSDAQARSSGVDIVWVNDGRKVEGESYMQWGQTPKERVVNFLTAILKDCRDVSD